MSHIIILTTLPNLSSAEQLANELIDSSLAACVNILPEMQSIYCWQGKRQRGTEHQLIIKTSSQCYLTIEKFIEKQHPYELPEIISLPVQQGLAAYLTWITETTSEHSET